MDGLRTLVLAVRDLSEQEFTDWKAAHHLAAIAMENREDELDRVYNQIERDLVLLGATAIEDKLQDGVPRTIANLRNSGINLYLIINLLFFFLLIFSKKKKKKIAFLEFFNFSIFLFSFFF